MNSQPNTKPESKKAEYSVRAFRGGNEARAFSFVAPGIVSKKTQTGIRVTVVPSRVPL